LRKILDTTAFRLFSFYLARRLALAVFFTSIKKEEILFSKYPLKVQD